MGIDTNDVASGAPLIGKALEQRGLAYIAIRVETVAACGLVRRRSDLTHLPPPECRRRHAAEAGDGNNLIHRRTTGDCLCIDNIMSNL